jgi:hypothetical protein
MANFSSDTDLQVYQPDILGFGVASFESPTDYHAKAREDIERDLRIKWFPVYQRNIQEDISVLETIEMDGTKLTDAQWLRCSVYKMIADYICPLLTKFNSDDNLDRFQMMQKYYQTEYEKEFQNVLRDGVEYDDDNSGTITTSEKEAYHRLRLIR